MKEVYCLSGLGADYRIFTRLKLPGVKLIHIPWPEHDKHDELSCYAQKVSALIKADNPIIMGVSLGGMIGVEIGKIRPVKKLILVSSAKTKDELPPYDTWFGKLMKSRILPPIMYKIPNSVLMDKFGVESDEDEALIQAILNDSDGRFMKWAMWAVATWENRTFKEPVVHIHGRQDKMLLPNTVNAQYWIDDGGHMMIYNRAAEISEIILNELADL
ncbi:MAG: alpha/beta hydrolase [Chitinophagales bacterium]|nr:alpha/beta hydrolase [Chitinophagaceae bacterium]MCB9065648.1 alpha/beta hydrolase [Chitinophagales bacterium]